MGVQQDEEEELTVVETFAEEGEREEQMTGSVIISRLTSSFLVLFLTSFFFCLYRWSCNEVGREGPDICW